MMKKTLIVLIILLVSVPCALAAAKSNGQITTVSALKAFDLLLEDPKTTFLVDVRSRSEYVMQGHAPRAYNVPWRFLTDHLGIKGQPNGNSSDKAEFTGYQLDPKPNPAFVGVVQSLFKPKDRLVLISTEGKQAAEAAEALKAAGYLHLYVVEHGFLGDPVSGGEEEELARKYSPHAGQRGRVNGWVFWGLPASNTVDPRYVYPPDLKRMQSGE